MAFTKEAFYHTSCGLDPHERCSKLGLCLCECLGEFVPLFEQGLYLLVPLVSDPELCLIIHILCHQEPEDMRSSLRELLAHRVPQQRHAYVCEFSLQVFSEPFAMNLPWWYFFR